MLPRKLRLTFSPIPSHFPFNFHPTSPPFLPQFPPNVLANSPAPASFQVSPPMSFVSDTWPTVRQFHDTPLNKVFALATCHDPCDAPAGPCGESSIPAPNVLWKILSCSHPCVLSRPVRCPYGLRHTVFGVFPLLTPLKKQRFRRHDVPLNVVFGSGSGETNGEDGGTREDRRAY